MFDAETVAEILTAPETVHAAGIVYRAATGRVLFLKRSDTGEWCGAGGKIEDGETPPEAAIRECAEEMGLTAGDEMVANPQPLARIVLPGLDFTAFIENVADEFTPTLNDEHTAWSWADPSDPPQPVHANTARLTAFMSADELGIARLMAFDGLASPQTYQNVTLFDLRITGTGAAYRNGAAEEFVWRDPSLCCNDEFLARCNGLPVIWKHPKGALLDSKEYAERTVGSIFLPYIKGEEVWGIAKIYDDEAIAAMRDKQLSTSPGVLVGGAKAEMEDGTPLLIENKPSLIDHLAVCEQGVWDKSADPVGVRLDSVEQGACMADEAEKTDSEVEDKKADTVEEDPKADEAKDEPKADADMDLKAQLDAMRARLDAYEKADAKKDADEEAKADSAATRAALADLEKRIPRVLTDADYQALSEAQARVDSVAQAFGQQGLRPMAGEDPLAYRRRAAASYQEHSGAWKGVALSALPADAFAVAEAAIYNDAVAIASTGAFVGPGRLVERIKIDEAGRRIKEFIGPSMAPWLDQFKIVPRVCVGVNRQSRA
jgi:8-oxo-dGTP pyrophosphatase MutT (NUDIX family)